MSTHAPRRISAAVAFLLLVLPSVACAGWESGDRAELVESTLSIGQTVVSSDGMGGMLVAVADYDPEPDRVLVTRVNHTGTEVWGEEGVLLAIDLSDQRQGWPIAVTHDGQGGAYVAYRGQQAVSDVIRLTHVNSEGAQQWTVAIDYLGKPGDFDTPAVTAISASDGDVILVWHQFLPTDLLYAARINQTGSIVWHGPVNSGWGTYTHWSAQTDGQGGALVGFVKGGEPEVVAMQRLQSSDGARLWGSDGKGFWAGPHRTYSAALRSSGEGGFDRFGFVADASGGAYMAMDHDNGQIWGLHVNASGNFTWMTEVLIHDMGTGYVGEPSLPRFCPDGVGGLIAVQVLDEVHVQRVNVNGEKLWGAGVVVATDSDRGVEPVITSDGMGGAILTWQNQTSLAPGTDCQQVNAARIDAFGAIVWSDVVEDCDYEIHSGGPYVIGTPHTAIPIADASGGALFAWAVLEQSGLSNLWVRGRGIAAGGGAPDPRLTFLHPDNAQPGDTGPYLILGDYLDLSLGYTLEKEDGSASLELSPTDLHNYQMVGGTTTLTELTPGAYHLTVQDGGGTPRDNFEYALGIGYPLTCDTEYTVLGVERAVDLAGSQRQTTWVDGGFLHAFWIEYTPFSPHYRINWMTRDGGWREQASPYSSDAPLSAPTVTSDSMNRLHLAFVEEIDTTHDQLLYMQLGEEGDILLSHAFDPGEVIRNPVIAWTQDNLAHVVMERGASPGNDLLHVIHNGSSFNAGVNPTTNGSPRTPDVAAMGTSIELVWASDSAVPGIQMIEQATYYEGMWHPARVVSFGLVMTSPSVAFDGHDQTLYAWIIDNELINGIPPLVHTQLRVGEELLDVRARPGWPRHHSVSVASPFAGKFVMFTSESEGGPVIRVVGREGDGKVFFPRLQVNAGTDIQHPRFAVQLGGNALNAYWQSFSRPTEPVTGANCEVRATSAPPPDVVTIDRRLIGRPNPFNPGTEFHFDLARESHVVLAVFDLRGRLVRKLFSGELDRGPHAIPWDGKDQSGTGVASGTYLVRLKRDDGSTALAKVALLK